VTVLFADLKGSMEILADRDPEQARRLLDPVLERMMEAVHHYEGTVNQVMGDGIMALFGAPLAHEDHAVRACYAALRMQESVKRYALEMQRTEGTPLHIRVGLNSGEVVVRSIGSDLRMDYSAVGQTTHLAARMEQAAMPGSILIPADTLRRAEGYVQVRVLGPMQVKGLAEAIDVYEVVGAGPVRTRFQAAAARGLTRFVGRDAEIEQLWRAQDKARAGHGQVAAIVGEPGVGKSRLVYEFRHSHRLAGWLAIQSGSVSYGKATPYLPVIDLVKAYFRIEDRDDRRTIREKVTGRLLTLDRVLEPLLPAFLALLDVPVDDADWEALDPPRRRQRTLEACRRLVLRESQVQPLVLVFEDLHWIDSETQAVLDSLVESLPAASLMLLVNYRPEYQHAWGSKTYYSQVRLDPLASETAEQLLGALLGDDPGLAPLRQLLIAATEGNPFFLEESVRTLVETGGLVGDRGAYRLGHPVDAIEVPVSVQAVLAARIDRLPPDDKRLLQSAAVLGKDVPVELLRAITDLATEDLQRGLTHLQAAEFLYETRLFPDLEYTFKHALTHEVAYGSLLHETRRALHARIVEAIEQLHGDRLSEHVERLAHHAVRGEAWEKALAYLHQSGAKAVERSAYREAVAYLEQALGALRRLPETRERLAQAVDLCLELRSATWAVGGLARTRACVQKAEQLARALGDPLRLGWVAVYTSHYLWIMGNPTAALESAVQAENRGERLADVRLRLAACYYRGVSHTTLGEYARAEEIFSELARALEGGLGRDRLGITGYPAVLGPAYWGWALAERGAFGEAIARCEDARRLGEALDHPYSLGFPYWHLGYIYALKGEPDEALRALDRAAVLTREIGSTYPGVTWCRGYALAGCPEGLGLLRETVSAFERMEFGVYHALTAVHLGEACVLAGELSEARSHGEHALTLARERHQRGYEGYALRLLGEVAALSTPRDAQVAQTRYREALALADQLGMRPLAARCHLGLAGLLERTGQRDVALAESGIAAAMMREMGMRLPSEDLPGVLSQAR
jgi:class 3 adenylate cyclase/tetratricopeptide (TPR) repeat protein